MKKVLSAFIFLFVCFVSISYVSAEEGMIQLNKTELQLERLHQETLTVSGNGETPVTWESSDANIASVDANGTVTAANEGTATITAKVSDENYARCQVTVTAAKPTLTYQTHVQTYGWQNWVGENAISGTSGQAKRLEGIKISLGNMTSYTGSIQYRTHVQTYGWQGNVSDGQMSGTSGEAKRLEAIQIALTGDVSEHYDVYYRVHCQKFGWLDWAKNGENAGSSGLAYRLEAIQIQLVEKNGAAPGNTAKPFVKPQKVDYRTHVQTYGWQGNVSDGQVSGTTGQAKRLEGIVISLDSPEYSGGIEYSTHVQTYGWQDFVSGGNLSGTTGEAKRLEAIKIRLTGQMAENYDVYYRVHAQHYGWLGWVANGQMSGTSGFAYRLEAIQIRILPKNAGLISTSNGFYSKETSGEYEVIKDASGKVISQKKVGGYKIDVDRSAHRVYVRRNSDNALVKNFLCTVGAKKTPTITGNYSIYTKRYYFDSDGGVRCFYFSPFKGGYGFHSVLYYRDPTPTRVKNGTLGQNLSHGCIRLNVEDAKWIYENCGIGTTVHIYN